MSKLKVYGIIGSILFVAVIGLTLYLNYPASDISTDRPPIRFAETKEVVLPQVTSFEECVAVTNLVYTSNPAKCVAPNGEVFVNSGFVHVKVITKTEKVK